MAATNFKFDFEFYGTAVVEMVIDSKHYRFESTYVGDNPLNSLITALWKLQFQDDKFFLDEDGKRIQQNESVCNFVWQNEPDGHLVKLCKKNADLQIVIYYFSDVSNFGDRNFMFEDSKLVLDTVVNFEDFTKDVCKAAINAIKKYGILGYVHSWDDNTNNFDFPIAKLMYLLNPEIKEDNSLYFSDFDKELLLLK